MKLKTSLLTCLGLMLATGYACAEKSFVTVAPQGEAIVLENHGDSSIRIKIKTHEVQIGKPSDGMPVVVDSNCTYSKYPCSIVDRLSITVGGVALFVPRSLFCDLADLNSAEIRTRGGHSVLTLLGGDASESYIIKINFDGKNISKRILSSAAEPDQPLEETIYHVNTTGD